MITFEKAKELFTYDRETGIIKWRKITNNNQRGNLVAGHTVSNLNGGYIRIRIEGKPYYAHRIAMLLSFGFCDDAMEVDHINHVRNDNRLVNLRFVTSTGNHRNQSRSSKNASGVTGVFYRRNRRRYMAQIVVDGVNIYLGTFVTLEEATEVRKAAEIKYKFNANHGTNKAQYVRQRPTA